MDGKIVTILLYLISTTSGSPVMTRQSLMKQKDKEHFCATLLNFNNFFYSLEEQRNITGIPADMSINWKTGNIFYTLISEEMKMSLQILRPSGEAETIKVAGLGQSTSVDNLNDIVYLATDNGVYKYKDDGSIELYTALGEDVMYIAVSSDGSTMYIATWPQNRVHKITNDGQKQETFSAIPNGHGLTIDTRNNIFFVATKTSYVLKSGRGIPIKIKGLPSDRMTGVFVTRSDEIYAMDENSNLYIIDSENASARHLGTFNVTGVNTFAMDSADNVLIGVKGAILKFNAYEINPCSDYEKKLRNWLKLSMGIAAIIIFVCFPYFVPVVYLYSIVLYCNCLLKKSGNIIPPQMSFTAKVAAAVAIFGRGINSKKGKRHSRKRKQKKVTTSTTEANEEDEEE